MPRRWWQQNTRALDVPFIFLPECTEIFAQDAENLMVHSWEKMRECDWSDPLLLLRHLEDQAAEALAAGRLPAWSGSRPAFSTVARIWPSGAHIYAPGCTAALMPACCSFV